MSIPDESACRNTLRAVRENTRVGHVVVAAVDIIQKVAKTQLCAISLLAAACSISVMPGRENHIEAEAPRFRLD